METADPAAVSEIRNCRRSAFSERCLSHRTRGYGSDLYEKSPVIAAGIMKNVRITSFYRLFGHFLNQI